MSKYTKEQAWDYLIETGIATEEELRLVTNIVGWTLEAMESVIYARTAYRSLEQLKSEIDGEGEDEESYNEEE